MFLSLAGGKNPASITLKRNKHSMEAVKQLKQKRVFDGAVVYRLDDLLQQLSKGLMGNSDIVTLGVETFRKLANTNSRVEFENCV